MVKIYAHKDILCIDGRERKEWISHSGQEGVIGCNLDAKHVEITPDAKSLLKSVETSGDDLGDIDTFKATGAHDLAELLEEITQKEMETPEDIIELTETL